MVENKKQNIDEKDNIAFNRNIFEGVDEVLQRDVVAIGNGAHINIPLKHLGKKAVVTILKKEEDFKK